MTPTIDDSERNITYVDKRDSYLKYMKHIAVTVRPDGSWIMFNIREPFDPLNPYARFMGQSWISFIGMEGREVPLPQSTRRTIATNVFNQYVTMREKIDNG